MKTPDTFEWNFPLPRTHTGIVQANGVLGTMIWGRGRTLRITLGRADLWDHRGGMAWGVNASFANIRRCLLKQNKAGLREMFEATGHRRNEPMRPSVLPLGRIDLILPAGFDLDTGVLNLRDGSVTVTAKRGGTIVRVAVHLDMRDSIVAIQLPPALRRSRIRAVPSWEYVGEELSKVGFAAPRSIRSAGATGWVQGLPADPAVAVAGVRRGDRIAIAVARDADPAAARATALQSGRDAAARSPHTVAKANRRWWNRYWRRVPQVEIPNPRLRFLYYYGMYKFAGFTKPDGVPATLQGPWIEEYRMPPWSSDYHFNINVQMCYQPAYHGNCLDHLLPLFDLVLSWQDTLRHNAKMFLGIDDGVMLPHAVDDRCRCMGGFWTGTLDHGCTAWVALMMHRYYRYSFDRAFLKRAYPFLTGAMRVYEEMIEKRGDALSLPLGVSPEYRGNRMDAWGRNASFQLACAHALAEACLDAARTLRRKPRAVWSRILKRLPKAALVTHAGRKQIGLWDGLVLEESHRHHSHMGAIAPFDVIDPDDPQWSDIVTHTFSHWIQTGSGLWSGWCLSWASMLHSRMGHGEAAEFYLDAFDRFYTNEGQGPVHDAWAAGFSLIGQGGRQKSREGLMDVMQVDGAMGSVAAIQEIFLHTRRGVNHLFAGVPFSWKNCSFSDILTDGAFLVSGQKSDGDIRQIDIRSQASGTIRVRNPWTGGVSCKVDGRSRRIAGAVLSIRMRAGEHAVITSRH